MIRRKFSLTATAGIAVAALLLSACGDGGASSSGGDGGTVSGHGGGLQGDPISGGTAQVVQISEPRNLDPLAIQNTWATAAVTGNAIYGTLMANDRETLEMSYNLAESFETTDGGKTFTLKVRPNVKFTDGTPFDAEAVKFNFVRAQEPTTNGSIRFVANQIGSMTVVDAQTLELEMVSPNASFALGIVTTSLNWIASPAALAKSREEFDANPVGAGPFKLVRWTRQDSIELEKNPGYWDAPRPYLDKLILKTAGDLQQRLNLITTDAVNVSIESNPDSLDRAEAAGKFTQVVPTGGGQVFVMNTRRAPFDDVRARRAVSLALDLESTNVAAFNGKAEVPASLFPESSPLYTGEALSENNAVEAQKLFDELAAEGKPVKFMITSVPTVDAKAPSESFQAQLSAFTNVDVQVEIIDFATLSTKSASKDYDMTVAGVTIVDPDAALWRNFESQSEGNGSGISDAELDKALMTGRAAANDADRKAAYATVEERLVDLVPVIWYVRATPSAMWGATTGGVTLYGQGSLLPEELWVSK